MLVRLAGAAAMTEVAVLCMPFAASAYWRTLRPESAWPGWPGQAPDLIASGPAAALIPGSVPVSRFTRRRMAVVRTSRRRPARGRPAIVRLAVTTEPAPSPTIDQISVRLGELAVPGSVTVSSPRRRGARLEWDAVAEAAAFRVERRSGGSWAAVGTRDVRCTMGRCAGLVTGEADGFRVAAAGGTWWSDPAGATRADVVLLPVVREQPAGPAEPRPTSTPTPAPIPTSAPSGQDQTDSAAESDR